MSLMPRLSEQFHLTPNDIWGLQWDELEAYVDAAKEADTEAKRAAKRYG